MKKKDKLFKISDGDKAFRDMIEAKEAKVTTKMGIKDVLAYIGFCALVYAIYLVICALLDVPPIIGETIIY